MRRTHQSSIFGVPAGHHYRVWHSRRRRPFTLPRISRRYASGTAFKLRGGFVRTALLSTAVVAVYLYLAVKGIV